MTRATPSTRPGPASVAPSTAATAAATTGQPWTRAAMIAAPTGPTFFSGSGISGISGSPGARRPRRARRRTRRTSATAPRAIWSRPAELMAWEESCCRLPPARTTVMTATTPAHAIHPAMKPHVSRRPPRDRMAMYATSPSGSIATIRARPTAESTRQHGSARRAAVGPRGWGSEPRHVAPPAQRLLDQAGPTSYAEQPRLLGLPRDDRGLDDVDVRDLA